MFVSLSCLLIGCTPRSVREAQEVVAQADSLWQAGQMYGVDQGDSATLAQAYETLKKHSAPSLVGRAGGEVFAHACYHYGKLLRTQDNPVAAMQCFIAATHSHTRDYHILGRVYSNMGSICHLAGEFPLSYDMYERSANSFLQGGDTTAYYYALNDMAFELAEQGKKEETYTVLNNIYKYNDRNIYIKTLETKAVACKLVQQYDSTIYYTSLLFKHGCYTPNILLNRAQAYALIGEKDSAVYYANELVLQSDELFYINSALYILTHEDDKKDLEEVRNISAERSDTQKLIEIRQGKLSQAVQLLEQDIYREYDYRWLYAILATFVIVGASIYSYIYYKRRQHALLSQKIEDLTIQNEKAVRQHTTLTQNINNLSRLQEEHYSEIVSKIEKFSKLIQCDKDLIENLHWNNYLEMCKYSNRYLFNIINQLQPYNLSQKEVRLCILVLLKLDTSQMINMIPYSRSGIGKLKYTTSKKLGTTTPNLRSFLMNLLR